MLKINTATSAALFIQHWWRSSGRLGLTCVLLRRYLFVHSHAGAGCTLSLEKRKSMIVGNVCLRWTRELLSHVRLVLMKNKDIYDEIGWLFNKTDGQWPSMEETSRFMCTYLIVLNSDAVLTNMASNTDERLLLGQATSILSAWYTLMHQLTRKTLLDSALVVSLFTDLRSFLQTFTVWDGMQRHNYVCSVQRFLFRQHVYEQNPDMYVCGEAHKELLAHGGAQALNQLKSALRIARGLPVPRD